MPRPRRSNLSRPSRNAIRQQNIANQLSDEQGEITREERRVSIQRRGALIRASQSREQSEAARKRARLVMQNRRANNRRQQIDNLRRRTRYLADLNRAAFRYDCNDYSLPPSVCIGQMDVVCEYSVALKFSGETTGLCCLNGKVKLPVLTPPHEPLYSLLCGETQESRHFLANTRKYNSCFQMTLGADIIEDGGFNPTFKIQGQIHHRIGSLLPFEDTQNNTMFFIRTIIRGMLSSG